MKGQGDSFMRKTSVLFILAKSAAAPFNGIYVINHLGPSGLN
ncbi:hypothetical protein B4144_4065 [Bacillus atrophaeus]|nr:hypothetical protein B4144_4065 [Bacillus atrophaeus]